MGILANAISGLQASQIALRTAGHNISNANTQGYSRQQVEYGTRPAQRTGAGYLGSGVNTQTIERVVSEFLTRQLRADTNTYNELNKFNEQIGTINKLLVDSGTGLSASLQSFFAAMQLGADDPASTPARQLIISEAESLTARFNLLYGRLDGVNSAIQTETSVLLSGINSLANSIAELNRTISQQQFLNTAEQPNDLLDKREEQLRKLSELVAIQVIEQDDGDINVMIGSGQPLVVGQLVSQFELVDGDQIILTNSITSLNVTDFINGGQLGGLVRFRKEVLGPTFNELGRVAIVLADEYNRIQEQGLDLDGDFGGLFFTDINTPVLQSARVYGDRDNAPPSDRNISVEIVDTSQLTIDDYELRIIENTQNYVITRVGNGEEVTQGILPGGYPTSIQFEGIEVHLTSGSFQGGDIFFVRPTRYGAVDIEAVIERPEDLALALPIRTATGSGNIGAGSISAGDVLSVEDAQGNRLPLFANDGELSPPMLIEFVTPTTYNVLDFSDAGNPVDLVPPLRNQPFIPGINNFVFSEDPGATLVTGSGAGMGLPAGRIATVAATGAAAVPNGYPAELLTFTTTDPLTGATSRQTLITSFNNSAGTTAVLLSNLEGVTANAFTELRLTDVNINNLTAPLQIRLNGEDLIGYNLGAVDPDVPDPALDEAAFNDYLEEQINNNANLNALGIYARSSTDSITGNPELRILASTGFDIDVRLEGVAGDTISVSDGVNPNVRLTAAGAGTESMVTVGGRIDLTLADNVVLTSAPSNSQFFGDSTAADFAQSVYWGIQVAIKDAPAVDDRFTIEYNNNASQDNRNAQRFVDMEINKVIRNDSLSLSGSYNQLVERVSTVSNLSQINTEASKALLQETQSARDALSGVNLDEEAANLIRFEQIYNANARVISVARDLFDELLNAI